MDFVCIRTCFVQVNDEKGHDIINRRVMDGEELNGLDFDIRDYSRHFVPKGEASAAVPPGSKSSGPVQETSWYDMDRMTLMSFAKDAGIEGCGRMNQITLAKRLTELDEGEDGESELEKLRAENARLQQEAADNAAEPKQSELAETVAT
jgi:hypothetical protein